MDKKTQKKLVRLARNGWDPKDICAELGVSKSTVSRVLASYRKLGRGCYAIKAGRPSGTTRVLPLPQDQESLLQSWLITPSLFTAQYPEYDIQNPILTTKDIRIMMEVLLGRKLSHQFVHCYLNQYFKDNGDLDTQYVLHNKINGEIIPRRTDQNYRYVDRNWIIDFGSFHNTGVLVVKYRYQHKYYFYQNDLTFEQVQSFLEQLYLSEEKNSYTLFIPVILRRYFFPNPDKVRNTSTANPIELFCKDNLIRIYFFRTHGSGKSTQDGNNDPTSTKSKSKITTTAYLNVDIDHPDLKTAIQSETITSTLNLPARKK